MGVGPTLCRACGPAQPREEPESGNLCPSFRVHPGWDSGTSVTFLLILLATHAT